MNIFEAVLKFIYGFSELESIKTDLILKDFGLVFF